MIETSCLWNGAGGTRRWQGVVQQSSGIIAYQWCSWGLNLINASSGNWNRTQLNTQVDAAKWKAVRREKRESLKCFANWQHELMWYLMLCSLAFCSSPVSNSSPRLAITWLQTSIPFSIDCLLPPEIDCLLIDI